jgi:aspartyl/glutamyl-tRNA(Asn/Gln) amidotransferase C subunit
VTSIDFRLVTDLERLARVELTPEERQRLSRELSRVVEFAGELRSVVTGPAPGAAFRAAHEPELASTPRDDSPAAFAHLRPDQPGRCLTRDAALRAAPETDARATLYRVPRVIEK